MGWHVRASRQMVLVSWVQPTKEIAGWASWYYLALSKTWLCFVCVQIVILSPPLHVFMCLQWDEQACPRAHSHSVTAVRFFWGQMASWVHPPCQSVDEIRPTSVPILIRTSGNSAKLMTGGILSTPCQCVDEIQNAPSKDIDFEHCPPFTCAFIPHAISARRSVVGGRKWKISGGGKWNHIRRGRFRWKGVGTSLVKTGALLDLVLWSCLPFPG